MTSHEMYRLVSLFILFTIREAPIILAAILANMRENRKGRIADAREKERRDQCESYDSATSENNRNDIRVV